MGQIDGAKERFGGYCIRERDGRSVGELAYFSLNLRLFYASHADE
jgi:hypothetical protein